MEAQRRLPLSAGDETVLGHVAAKRDRSLSAELRINHADNRGQAEIMLIYCSPCVCCAIEVLSVDVFFLLQAELIHSRPRKYVLHGSYDK